MINIIKERINIVLLVDSSGSMSGRRIRQVDEAINDIRCHLIDLEAKNTNVEFYITLISFNTTASFYSDSKATRVKEFNYEGAQCGGHTNLHLGYDRLIEIMNKESKGGIMPDFGGAAPILLLLTDGHPNGNAYKEKLKRLKDIPWFKAALRYAIAIELNDERTREVLHDFVGNNGEVITCYNASVLKDIIPIIVLTASEAQATDITVASERHMTQNAAVQQAVAEALSAAESRKR